MTDEKKIPLDKDIVLDDPSGVNPEDARQSEVIIPAEPVNLKGFKIVDGVAEGEDLPD